MCTLLYVTLVMPDNYTVYQSNQFDSNFQCLQDDQCKRVISNAKKRSSGERRLLTCVGPNSTLFNGITGRDIRREDFEQTDYLQHYTWQQDITPNPIIEMFFFVPLVELSNVTLYFFRDGPIQVPRVTMCFSSSLNFVPCNNIDLPNRPGGLQNGVIEWPITLLTNATSVIYLRINFQFDNENENDFIFLSEIRIAERLKGSYVANYICHCSYIIECSG